ncbi:GumC family protein [Desulfosarcina ovata]|uniref:Polysaccharide chain length determinant N-terminal domain-containing protein n=1 Tax=Desulfosarcina ovata subsp. ovata TaxID=2752305 RepID=A0A5K8A5E1_9BACT|nr:GumC family protein [Desulfosarcina ovata]BBO87707.1 hypothetical protein DSCOOX_08870 [Desulfosarcina ovata subsp. ovata]
MPSYQAKPVRTSLRDVFFILFYKAKVFVSTVIVIAAVVIVYSLFTTPLYKASGSVLLKPLFDSSQRLHTQERFDVLPVSEQDINSEINIMRSDALLRQVVETLDLHKKTSTGVAALFSKHSEDSSKTLENAVLRLRKAIEIKPVPISSIINVSLKGDDSKQITKIINTFLNAYIDYHINVHRPGGGVDFYSQQTENAKQMLRQAEEALKDFEKKESVIDIPEQKINNVTLMRALSQEASLLKAQISQTETILDKLRPFLKHGKPLDAIPEELRTHEILVDLQKALIPLLVEKERIALMYPVGSVEYTDAQNQVNRIEKQIRVLRTQVLNGVALDLEALNRRKTTIEVEMSNVERQSTRLTLNEIQLNRLKWEVEQRQRNYQLYLDIREDAIIQAQRERSRVANVSVTDWAIESSIPIYPKKVFMTLMALIAGIFAGIGGAFAAFFLDHSIKRPEDIEKAFQLPVLGDLGELDGVPNMDRNWNQR